MVIPFRFKLRIKNRFLFFLYFVSIINLWQILGSLSRKSNGTNEYHWWDETPALLILTIDKIITHKVIIPFFLKKKYQTQRNQCYFGFVAGTNPNFSVCRCVDVRVCVCLGIMRKKKEDKTKKVNFLGAGIWSILKLN